MTHTCHWPDCKTEVPPKLWGCKNHWFQLPERLRALIWKTYRPGQEIDKRPSPEYLAAAKEVHDWILKERKIARELWRIEDIAETEQGQGRDHGDGEEE